MPVADVSSNDLNTSTSDSSARTRVLTFNKTKNVTLHHKVTAAILANDNAKQGVSASKITKWILGNYATSDPDKLSIAVKKHIVKSLNNGTLERRAGSKSLGALGSFVLPDSKHSSRKSQKTKAKLRKSVSVEDYARSSPEIGD